MGGFCLVDGGKSANLIYGRSHEDVRKLGLFRKFVDTVQNIGQELYPSITSTRQTGINIDYYRSNTNTFHMLTMRVSCTVAFLKKVIDEKG